MKKEDLVFGKKVKVISLSEIKDYSTFPMHDDCLKTRQIGLVGKIRGLVPGQEGNYAYVKHNGKEDSFISVYHYSELELLP